MNLRVFIEASVIVGVPLAMIGGVYLFGYPAWIRMGMFTELVSDYYAGLLAAGAILLLIELLPIPREHRRALALLWLIRCGVALGFSFYFEANHSFDSVVYFLRGTFFDQMPTKEIGGNEIIYGLVHLCTQIYPSYNLSKVIFSAIGLMAIYAHYAALRLFLGRDVLPILYVIGIFPSVLFWTSMLSKEPLTLLGIGIYSFGVVGLYVKREARYVAFVILGVAIAMSVRTWLGMIFLAPLVGSYVLSARTPLMTKLGFMIVAVPAFLFALQSFSEQFAIESAQDLVQTSDHLSQAWAHGNAAQEIQGGFTSLGSMVAFMPLGAFTALFRPLPGEVLNPLGMLAGIENSVALWLWIMVFYRHGFRWLRDPLLLWAALLLLCWAAVYGFVSYQNLGTAFRFRVQVAIPLFLVPLYLLYGRDLVQRAVPSAQVARVPRRGAAQRMPGE